MIYSSSLTTILDTVEVSWGLVPNVSSMRRTELEALLNAIALIACIHKCNYVTKGKIDVYCLSKTTTRLMHGLLYHSVSSALDDHGELLAELSHILWTLSSKSTIHYKYLNLAAEKDPPTPLHYINQLGTDISSHCKELDAFPPQDYISPSKNTINLRYQGRPLVTKIRPNIRKDLYSEAIQATICKQEDWTPLQFHSVDWDALEYAFSRTWSCKCITYTKLKHILWQQLFNTNTPETLIQAIQNGVLGLGYSSRSVSTSSPLVAATVEHQTTLRWEAFLRGRISCKWRPAYSGSNIPLEEDKTGMKWAGQLVGFILNYSQQLWVFWCGVLHGHIKEETWQRHQEELIKNIQVAYEEYEQDPFCVPSDWWRLFGRPLGLLTTA
jgi:hypothetical protein